MPPPVAPLARSAVGLEPPRDADVRLRPTHHAALARLTDRLARTPSLLTIGDQAIVSGVSFLTTVIVGRMAGVDELGLYALGGTLALAIGHVQESLVSLPYTIFANRATGPTRPVHAGTALLHHRGLAAGAAVALVLAAVGLGASGAGPLSRVVWMLALAVPFVLLRDLARRLAFADLTMHRALALDGAVASIQIVTLCGLAALGRLSAATAWLSIGLACALVGIGWLRGPGRQAVCRRDAARAAIPTNWRFGRWVTASRLMDMANSEYLLLWLLAIYWGKAAAGALAMCMTVVLFSNPIIMGVGHTLTPKAARAFTGGGRAVRRVVWRTTLGLGAVMTCYSVAVWIFADDVLRLLYGRDHEVHALAAFVLTIYVSVSALDLGAHEGLHAIGRPDMNFKLSLLGSGAMVAAASWLIMPLGVLGAAVSLLIAATIEAIVRIIAFCWLTQETRPGMAGIPHRSSVSPAFGWTRPAERHR